MSTYSTGELAKLCNVSVRTVQYYDTKGLLEPTERTEGGRRLYADDDLKKLQFICVLKHLGLSLDSIRAIIESGTSKDVLVNLFDNQIEQLQREINEKQHQIKAMQLIQKNTLNMDTIPANLIFDIERMMKNKNKLQKTYKLMTIVCIGMILVQIGFSVYWILEGNIWPYLISFPSIILLEVLMMKIYHIHAIYVCPKCTERFQPTFGTFLFSFYKAKNKHHLKMRKLKCPQCGATEYCIENTIES